MNLNYILIQLCFLHVFFCVTRAAPELKTSTQSNEACQANLASCDINGENGRRAVCGSDGRTYASRCHLLKAQCSGAPVTFARRGPCGENQSSCQSTRKYALSAKSGRRAKFVPRCRADGTYAPVQCVSAGTGCWCVTPNGKTLPDTTVTNGRPDCSRAGKSHTRRRSSARGQRNKRICTRTDRSQFNANLIKIFSGELERSLSDTQESAERTAVADWKFQELDRDNSGSLQKSEYRGLRRLIKKVVKPKRCARAWARSCDLDGNSEIASSEWTTCLLGNPETTAPDYEDNRPEPEPDYGEEDPTPIPSPDLPVLSDVSDMDTHREDEANDCLTDRQAVLDEQKAGGSVLYVPECTGDGRYARAQCYRSTGYCWCVHQDTGKPIAGSSVKDARPDCDAAPQHASPMRGCPEPMKSNFLHDLINYFITKMTSTSNGTGPGEMVKWGASKEEQAATWTFVMLDKDKNKVLERREWKAFHQLISTKESLRRCGRKLPRYCDVNHDTKISITEWMSCLEVTQASHLRTNETTKPPTVSLRRKGPNPLESILKADD